MKTGTIKAAVAAALLITGVAASAAASERYVKLGAGTGKLEGNSQTQYTVGYGGTSYTQSGFLWGVDVDGSYQDMNGAEVWGLAGTLRLGYALFDDRLALYGLGGALMQSLPGTSGYGFGFGGGADYRFVSWLRAGAEYTTYSMTMEAGSYDYSQATVFAKIIW